MKHSTSHSIAIGGFACACIALCQSLAAATPPEAASTSTPPTAAAAVAPAAPAKPTAPPAKVEVSFTTIPPTDAVVTWGKTRLGRISAISPLVIVRPRDSGPLDVVVRADGFLPVQTRAHTFADTRVSVKLTRPEETSTLLGYRVPIAPKVETPTDAAPYDPNMGPLLNVTPSWNMTAPQNVTPITPVQTPTPNVSPVVQP